MKLEVTEQIINDYVADILENGTDDALFASGYLQGHLDLILQGCFANAQTFEQFLEQMEQSLSAAYGKNELSPNDRKLVEQSWDNLKSQF